MIAAYYVIHYGSDYLAYSIKSIYNFVDKIFIFYTNKPSHGHNKNLINPDTRDKLWQAAFSVDPQHKIIWEDGQWAYEGAQRDHAVNTAEKHGADTVLVVDADEIWTEDVLVKFLDRVKSSGKRMHCIRMLTFWRSFSNICVDEMMPVRAIRPKIKDSSVDYCEGRVLHFGYARKPDDITYKISCHGHSGEWDQNWYKNKFIAWPGCGNLDLHPTCRNNTWEAKAYDKELLPTFMKSHPYFNLNVIQ